MNWNLTPSPKLTAETIIIRLCLLRVDLRRKYRMMYLHISLRISARLWGVSYFGLGECNKIELLLLLSRFSLSIGSVWPHRWQPTMLPRPWDSPGKNTGVGCHFLLQCMKVKSESEVAQSCPTISDPMDCSQPGASVHGIFQARVLEWGAIAFSENNWLRVKDWDHAHVLLPCSSL